MEVPSVETTSACVSPLVKMADQVQVEGLQADAKTAFDQYEADINVYQA